MPDNLAAALTEDELIDVVEYLTKLQTASLTPESWQIAGPFDSPGGNDGLDAAHGPEKGAFDVAAKFKGKLADVTWKSVRTTAANYLDLAALHGNAGANSLSYAYKEIESPADQDATVLLGTDDGGKLSVNGTEVFTSRETRAAAPAQNQVPVKLKKGKNTILLKIANGNNPHGFYFTILSGQELKAMK